MFTDIFGYEQTVIPELQRAILKPSQYFILGLRGQAKTKMARQLVNLFDEYIPVVAGSPLNDDPLVPVSAFAKELIAVKGNRNAHWLDSPQRTFCRKLATPDVSVADLIGDLDPIKAANLKLSLADEKVITTDLCRAATASFLLLMNSPTFRPACGLPCSIFYRRATFRYAASICAFRSICNLFSLPTRKIIPIVAVL